MNYTIEQPANTWGLWAEYVDPDAAFTREEWDEMTAERREELVLQVVDANA